MGHDAQMAAGQQNQFDVLADSELVFSKEATGRFPELSDLLPALK